MAKFVALLVAIISCCAAQTIRAEPAMWVIKSDVSTIYLIGTIHILRSETDWETDKIRQAIHDSRELWLEVAKEDEEDMARLLHIYGFDPTHPLTQRLTPEEHERLAAAAAEYTFPISLLDQMKPWYAAINLELLPMLKAGYNPNAGADEVLKVQARAERHAVQGLESMQDQIRLLNDLPPNEQVAFLRETLTDVQEGLARLEEVSKAWVNGDTEALTKSFVAEMQQDDPSLFQHLVVERNKRWSRQIAALLGQPGVRMIAVGTAHLLGPDSVQAQLAKVGIKAERY